ncbi:hypothetical protein [Oceanospirillum linum]|uniref:hypothetical protein n=1 Tax=Oceanospirillum linum TaxID=966 RepID=UPI001116109C|nr:hypothetical protein [Oceanospirillum linum]
MSSISAAQLHQKTSAPYTQCVEILRNFTPAQAKKTAADIPPPSEALKKVFQQNQRQLWQAFWQEHKAEIDTLTQGFSDEKKQLVQTADERLEMIKTLEQSLSEKESSIRKLQKNSSPAAPKTQQQDSASHHSKEIKQLNRQISDYKDEIARLKDQVKASGEQVPYDPEALRKEQERGVLVSLLGVVGIGIENPELAYTIADALSSAI